MHKKLITACVALVALAAMAVVPAMASASPVLTNSEGKAVAAGTAIKAVNVGNVVLTSTLGNVECSTAELAGSVKTNSGKLIEGNITSTSFTSGGGACSSTFFGNPKFTVDSPQSLCLVSSVLGSGTIKNGACPGTAGVSFTLTNSEGLGNCTFTASEVPFTYVANTSPLHLTVEKVKFTSSGCNLAYPKEGFLDGTFKVTTSTGGELSVS